MRLRYTKGDSMKVGWAGTKPFVSVTFSPNGEVEDSLAERLLANPQYPGWFERIEDAEPTISLPKQTFKCDVCGEEKKSKAGLGAHKRKHKEIQNEAIS